MITQGRWKLIALTSTLLAAVAFVTIIFQSRELSSLKALVDSGRSQQESSQRPRQVEAAAQNQSSLTNLHHASEDDRAVACRERAIAAKRAAEAKAIATAQDQFLFSSETQKRAAQAFKAGLKLRYGRWYSAAGFSAQDVASFEGVMEERFWAMSDLVASARNNGVTDRAVSELKRQALESTDGKLRVLLGDDRYRDLLRYDSTADARGIADIVTGNFYDSGAPLTDVQVDRLVGVIAANRANAPRSDDWLRAAVFLRAAGNTLSDVDWTKVGVAATQFLSPAQVSALQAQQALIQARQDVDRELKHISDEARQSTPTK